MSQSRHIRYSASWLLIVAAILLRAAVPAGWMPVADDGGVRLMLCSGMGPVEFSATPSSQHHAHQQGHHGHHDDAPQHDEGGHDPCPYGLALGKMADLPGAIESPPPAVSDAPPRVAAAPAILLVSPRNLHPPARAPPLLA